MDVTKHYPVITWGWKISCCQNHCKNEWMEWGKANNSTGAPSLPHASGIQKNNWFFFYLKPGYKAYCQDHAGPVIKWHNEDLEWKRKLQDERQRLFKDTNNRIQVTPKGNLYIPLRLFEAMYPSHEPDYKKIEKLTKKWISSNPRPPNPWNINLEE